MPDTIMTIRGGLMLSEERHGIILKEIEKRGVSKVGDLCKLTNSSESTIRRDLSYLEERGRIRRVHGGAVLNRGIIVEEAFNEKLIQNRKEKNLIARFAASLIEDGDSIYLDSGTTVYEMIKYIDQKDIFIVTNGIDNVDILLNKGINVYILGGKVKPKSKAIVGTNTFNELEKFRFDKAFIGVNGIDIEFGFTTADQEEAIIKDKAIEVSIEAFILADSSKFNKTSFTKISDFREVTVITDKENRQYKRKLNLKLAENDN